jgi:GNAT superfamily N-acetyltransferase
MPSLFNAGAVRCDELGPRDVSKLQRFIEANPEYYIAVNGSAPGPTEAQDEFDSLLPADWPFEKRWLLAFTDERDAMIGMANVTSNLFIGGLWHLGLFIIATALHGRGTARTVYNALESWMRERGARWVRLGVVEGNRRAERFWENMGYVDVRRRLNVAMGNNVNDLRVMAKPLAQDPLSAYLTRVPRDQQES